MVSTFHLRARPVSGLTNIPPIKPEFEVKEPMAAPWSSDHLAIYRNLQLCLVITNDLSLAIRSSRIDWKVTLMQLGYQFNSYNLKNHKQDIRINKTQERWLDAPGVALITTMLASSPLDACGPPNTHRTCSA
jgi:hypothetical protein